MENDEQKAMDEIEERATQIRLVLTDCDGVLTDGGQYYGPEGETLKRFNIRDGMGVQRLRQVGVETGILTEESSPVVKKRAEKLRITELHLGVEDKLVVVKAIAQRNHLELSQIAYLGDDADDIAVLDAVGFAACPDDAYFALREHVDLVLASRGGNGAFRELAEYLRFTIEEFKGR